MAGRVGETSGVATIAECPLFWHTEARLEPLKLRSLSAAASGAKAIAAENAPPAVASGAMSLVIIGGSFLGPVLGIHTGGEELASDCLLIRDYAERVG